MAKTREAFCYRVKNWIFVAVHGDDFMILACVVLTQYRSVTDGRTDGRFNDG